MIYKRNDGIFGKLKLLEKTALNKACLKILTADNSRAIMALEH
jgi:hypothetical protein